MGESTSEFTSSEFTSSELATSDIAAVSIVETISITSTAISTTTTDESDTCYGQNDWTCNPVGLLIAVILLVLLLYIILALTRILLCFVYRRRQQNTAQMERTNREIEEIGHPFSYLAERGFDNSGFVDPPPTYEQLFKRDEPPPVYETPAMQRRPVPDLHEQHPSTSSITSAPATYTYASEIPRSTSRNSLPIGVFGTSVPSISNSKQMAFIYPIVVVTDETYRSRNNTMADSPDEGFLRPSLIVPPSQEPPEAGSPTRENLI